MKTVNVYEAKTSLSKLIAAAGAGEEIVLARNGQPVAKLVPLTGPPGSAVRTDRGFAMDAGLFEVPDDFDAPLPEDVLSAFER